MGMKQTLDVINQMEAEGVIGRYAIAGAVAAYNYIEPTLTEDLDLLVSFGGAHERPQSGLVTLAPIFSYLKNKGHTEHRNEGILIAGWPVQFLPVANALDEEALEKAEEISIVIPGGGGTVNTRVLQPQHLVATALRVGRPKDLVRISQFLDAHAVNLTALVAILKRHGLVAAWVQFCERTGIADPLSLQSQP